MKHVNKPLTQLSGVSRAAKEGLPVAPTLEPPAPNRLFWGSSNGPFVPPSQEQAQSQGPLVKQTALLRLTLTCGNAVGH